MLLLPATAMIQTCTCTQACRSQVVRSILLCHLSPNASTVPLAHLLCVRYAEALSTPTHYSCCR
jgi:hypothetical protein